MSATRTTTRPTPAMTTPLSRMTALARAEMTLLGRTKGALVAALFAPLVLPVSTSQLSKEMDLAEVGLNTGTLVLPASVGFSLLFAVYSVLVGALVVRREELVLKRLRTGELRDVEILAGSALPAVLTGLVQCLVLAVACSALLDLSAPSAPHLAVVGLLLGLVMCAGARRRHRGFTRTGESAQVTPMPLRVVSWCGSVENVRGHRGRGRALRLVRLVRLRDRRAAGAAGGDRRDPGGRTRGQGALPADGGDSAAVGARPFRVRRRCANRE
ncbi:hypothetical protein SVIOM74S_04572 [Streptomyces violarus]